MLSSMATLTGGEAGAELVDEAAAGVLRLLDPTQASALICGDVPGVKEASGVAGGEKSGGGATHRRRGGSKFWVKRGATG